MDEIKSYAMTLKVLPACMVLNQISKVAEQIEKAVVDIILLPVLSNCANSWIFYRKLPRGSHSN